MSPAPVVLAAVPTLFGPDGELDRDANRALYKLIAGLLDGLLVAACSLKFLHGGWFPLLLALAMFAIMSTWKRGRCGSGSSRSSWR